jgi:hypothetical protein
MNKLEAASSELEVIAAERENIGRRNLYHEISGAIPVDNRHRDDSPLPFRRSDRCRYRREW